MNKYVTDKELHAIIRDPSKQGNYISLKNNQWTCLKKSNNEIILKTTTNIIEATKFLRGNAQ